MTPAEMAEYGRRCSVDGCLRRLVARGMCGTHWRRWRREGGDTATPAPERPRGRLCSVGECENPHVAWGFCGKHLARFKKYGDPTYDRYFEMQLAKVDRSAGDCWVWTGQQTPNGYGLARQGGTSRMAHRVIYERLVGPVPQGLDLDHLCRNRLCVNPQHLEPVTRAENMRRARAAR